MLPPDTFDAQALPAPQTQGIYDAAWAAYQRNRDAVTRGRALVGGLSAAPTVIAWLLHEFVGFGAVLKWVGYLGSSLVFVLLMPGLTHLAIKIARGEQGAASDVFSQIARAPTWVVTALLHGIAVCSGFLLIVPGLLLQQRLQFAEQFAVARDLGPFEALEASWRVTRMQGWGLFKIGLLEEWNFANRTSVFRRGVDASGASVVESAVLYLVYEARLFGDEAGEPRALEITVPVPDPVIAPSTEASALAAPAALAGAAFACPRCGGAVPQRQAGEYSVFPCTGCGGVWVDNAVSQRIVRAYEHNAVVAAEEASRLAARTVDTRPWLACPICGSHLLRVPLRVENGIEIDACPSHGTWFDRDELPRVVRALTQRAAAHDAEPFVIRTAGNTVVENLANAGRTALDLLFDAIANVRISIPDSAWEDRDAPDRDEGHHHHGGGGAWFNDDAGTDHHHHHGGGGDSSAPEPYCNDNDTGGSCNDNDTGGGHHRD